MDGGGDGSSLGAVRLTLKAGAARTLTAQQLEQGDSRLTGRWGEGEGKWRLSVSADRPLQVMSLLRLRTGHLTNLSRGQVGISVGMLPSGPDLVAQPPSVSDSSLNAGQAFTLSATVRNQGEVRSAATILRYFRSSDSTISTADTAVGMDPVNALAVSGVSDESISLTAPSSAGAYYYGACVDSVSGESNTRNNCLSAIRVTVGGSAFNCRIAVDSKSGRKASYCNTYPNRWGAIAAGWMNNDPRFFGWNWSINYSDPSIVASAVLARCRFWLLRNCKVLVRFSRCGALAYGESSTHRRLAGGYGTTQSAAEQSALSECRSTGMTSQAKEQSGNAKDFLLDTLKLDSHS